MLEVVGSESFKKKSDKSSVLLFTRWHIPLCQCNYSYIYTYHISQSIFNKKRYENVIFLEQWRRSDSHTHKWWDRHQPGRETFDLWCIKKQWVDMFLWALWYSTFFTTLIMCSKRLNELYSLQVTTKKQLCGSFLSYKWH